MKRKLGLLLFIIIFLSFKKDERYVFKFYYNNSIVKNGFVHFYSNDKFINEISFCALKDEEKTNSCKIRQGGIYIIDKDIVNRNYNKCNKDTIRGFLRCDGLLGLEFKFNKNDDTIKIYLSDTLNLKSCFTE